MSRFVYLIYALVVTTVATGVDLAQVRSSSGSSARGWGSSGYHSGGSGWAGGGAHK
ncbi:hypothetical protein [Andreprevotia chitinilytica]|uniref:hypothetical protein n=1 Tax=Andreprevotia chitinilytica TaxID=396808 RepID=UPI00147063AE|nr:hypothetical protein [Andreprevotia chitinilytica]